MVFDAPFWIFPLLPAVLMLLCVGALYWALTQMAPLGNRPRLAMPTGAPPAPPRAAYAAPVTPPAPAPVAPPTPAVADDLTIIEGIGPRIAAVLTAAGIPTLAALAQTNPQDLIPILRNAGLNMAQPDTWPEQARLAASGQHEALRALQDRLRAGT